MQNCKGDVNRRVMGMGGRPTISAGHSAVKGAVAAEDIGHFQDQFHIVALLFKVEPGPVLVKVIVSRHG